MEKIKKNNKNYFIYIFLFIFFIISISTIYSANTYLPSYLGNLSLKQSLYYLLGILLIIVIKKINNNKIYKYIDIIYIINVFLLFLLLIIGRDINGSKCWFVIPYIGSFQPSEFMKMILIIKLSKDFEKFFNNKFISVSDEFIFILKELIIVIIPSILTFLEPDTGSVIMYLISFFALFIISPFHKRWLVIAASLLLTIISLFIYLYFFNNKLFIRILGTNIFYRIDRVINWKNGSGMQLENSLTSIGSSNLFGHGYNKTPLYFPESGTDFIFSVFANNFGLIGSILLIMLLVIFDIYLIRKAKKKILLRYKLILISFISILLYQQLQNISMTLGIIPITGITLPFISYGGSSLLSYMFMIGIILNNDKEKE